MALLYHRALEWVLLGVEVGVGVSVAVRAMKTEGADVEGLLFRLARRHSPHKNRWIRELGLW